MWLGSPQSFEAFTFSFRENEHGIFQIHAYQFERDTSTVIVECDEASWRNAGLDRASTERRASSTAGDSSPRSSAAGRCSRTARGGSSSPPSPSSAGTLENVVLIGDAAHTAHFSVGSGTKLAMEDSIALADALRDPGDLGAALDRYEGGAAPWVGKTQKAAQQSLEWFESVRRYWHFEPTPFAFSLLTRSRRITHENLRVRDAELVERADRWYLETSASRSRRRGARRRRRCSRPSGCAS
ncbi:MAG: hypothetical protein M5U28_12770 [Sandaracinaceae bacterium]|nr:hypothetical protein [Sandaracinaceae bacterium]